MKRASILVLLFIPFLGLGQYVEKTSVNSKLGLLYTKNATVGFKLASNGWGVFGTLGKSINQNKSRFYELEFREFKHPREEKQTSENYGGAAVEYAPRPFAYGKQNVFFAIHLGVGRKMMIGEKAEKSGVEVSFNYSVGPSLGLLKPYYLDLIYSTDPGGSPIAKETRPEKYGSENAAKFLNLAEIYGSSGFSRGLLEVKPIPGLHAKAGLNFDWASWGDFVKALEVGFEADLYYKRIPIMVTDQLPNNINKAYFIGIYVSAQLGKKW